jgi:type IV secretion system protein VirD4
VKKRSLTELMQGYLLVTQVINSLAPPSLPEVEPPPPLDPMEGFANAPELDRYAMKSGAFYLGRIHEDHGVNFHAGIDDDRHLFLFAGSRSGKGVSYVAMNAALWPGPLFIIDPKGEAASITAIHRARLEDAKGTGTSVRRFKGGRVAILDPLREVRGPARAFRITYNPLVDIDLSEGGGVRAIQAFADALIHTEKGSGAHFGENAETIVAGVLEAIKTLEPPERQTLLFLRDKLLAGFDDLLFYLSRVVTQAGLAREAAAVMSEVGTNEWGSFRSTLSRSTKWLAEPAMQAHLNASSFSLRQAVQDAWSIYVVLQQTEVVAFRSWLRLISRIAIDAKVALGPYQSGPRTLFMLDEFASLGRFKIIEDSAGFLAGYGMKLMPIIQNLGQLQELYARNWETFLGNAGAIIAFGLNDSGSEKYVADRIGRIIQEEYSQSTSAGSSGQMIGGSASTGSNWNKARHERPIRFPNEIHEQGARETGRAFIIPASGRAFTVRRQSYTSLPQGSYDAPEFISRWEERFSSLLNPRNGEL